MRKIILLIIVIIVIIIAVVLIYKSIPKLNLLTGYASKNANSSIYIANRLLDSVSLNENNFSPIRLSKTKLDDEAKITTSSLYGLKPRKALFREGLGSVLINDNFDIKVKRKTPKRDNKTKMLPYPYGVLPCKDTLYSEINYTKLNKVTDGFLNDYTAQNQTRTVLVYYKNNIISEKYAKGYDENSKTLGWSIAKSLLSTVYGVMSKEGLIDINETNLFKEWENDGRSAISINNLLQMNSGLEWNEDYNTISDVTKMLFFEEDMGSFQMNKILKHEPNTFWNYSSGTTNLLNKIMRERMEYYQDYLDYPYSKLIDKIGMNSMILEADMNGSYVMSSYAWATTRDWAKFGILHLNKGNWNGEQIVEESWIDYLTTPTDTSNGEYGGQFWLNKEGLYPDIPKDTYYASGYQGQRIVIIPSRDIVIVMTAFTKDEELFDFNTFVKDILDCIEK